MRRAVSHHVGGSVREVPTRAVRAASLRVVVAPPRRRPRRTLRVRQLSQFGVTKLEAQDPDFDRRVRDSFARQRFMATIGARLARVAPGEVDIEIAVRDALAQQHDFVHAGALATIADSACGYAALSLMPPGAAVLSVEFKINMLAPAKGERVVAHGSVLRAGRNITVCRADVVAHAGDTARLVATMTGTMMTVRDRGLSD